MTLWIVLTILTSFAAIAVAAPFIRRFDGTQLKSNRSIAVYKDQLLEISREREQGILDESSAKLAETEIERRILAHQKDAAFDSNNFSPPVRVIGLATVAGLVVIGATSLYALTGRPEIPSAPFASEPVTSSKSVLDELEKRFSGTNRAIQANNVLADSSAEVGDAEQLVVNLAARLEQNPDDAQGWRMLGWSYFNTKRYDKAAKAYARAVALKNDDPDLQSAYGETLVRAADGFVTGKAIEIFDKTLSLNSSDPRARFFKGLALEQSGNSRAAIKAWTAILNNAPANADWVEGLRLRVQELAAASSINIAGRAASKPIMSLGAEFVLKSGPTAEDIKAASTMPAEDRQAMIRSMVDRLANRLEENPQNAEGWVKLMRSRLVLGDKTAAIEAMDRANKVFESKPEEQARIAAVAVALGLVTK